MKYKQCNINVGYNARFGYFYVQDCYINQNGVARVMLTHIDECESIKTIEQAEAHYIKYFLPKHNKIKENDKEKPDEEEI